MPALGEELQGDLHLVIVQNSFIDGNPDGYLLALKAYWQSPKFGKDAISKNSIIVVLGTDGSKVNWARAITGMPLGNEVMLLALSNNLKDVALTPKDVIGSVKGEFYWKEKEDGTKKLKVRGIQEDGMVQRVLWGLDDPQTKFVRISMSGSDSSDVGGGFSYLKKQIQPTASQRRWIVFFTILVSGIVWVVFAFVGTRVRDRYHGRGFYY